MLFKIIQVVLAFLGFAKDAGQLIHDGSERQAGAAEAANEINADTAQIQKDMANAQALAPATPGALADRLRREAGGNKA